MQTAVRYVLIDRAAVAFWKKLASGIQLWDNAAVQISQVHIFQGKKMKTTHRFAAAAVTLFVPCIVLAQTSELYLNDWTTTNTFVVQGGKIIRQFKRDNTKDGTGLVVQSTIKNIGQDSGNVGREYDLNGNPLGGRYTNPGFTSLYDGATDGERNWSIGHNDFNTRFAVVQGDADWGGLKVLFVPNRRSSGIAYDSKRDSFWITNNSGGSDRVQQYDLSGNVLSEFPAVHSGGGYGLAWDAADDTLWLPGAFSTGRKLFQYDTNGKLLQTVDISDLTPQILGAEFALTPEPATAVLLALGGLLATRRRR